MEAIKKIPNASSTRPDKVPSTMIRMAALPIARMLKIIAENSLEIGIFPENYKNTFIVGIYKGGDRNDPA